MREDCSECAAKNFGLVLPPLLLPKPSHHREPLQSILAPAFWLMVMSVPETEIRGPTHSA